MKLYTCEFGTSAGSAPGPLAHPCGRAAKALDDAGFTYEVHKAEGAWVFLWKLPHRGRLRKEVEELSGQRGVPILVLDDGQVVTGSGEIVAWARAQQRSSSGTSPS